MTIKRVWTALLWRMFPILQPIGVHVLPVRFDSPIPDTRELRSARSRFDEHHPMTGIDIDLDRQLQFLQETIKPWEQEYASAGGGRFGLDHSRMVSYAPANALTLYAIIRGSKPARMLEVGSGMSTYVAAAAFRANAADGAPGSYTVFDPYASDELRADCAGVNVIAAKVEDIGLEPFLALEAEDILFIDSSHTVKAFGDVNFLFLTVLPVLKPGVVIHVHDIFFPREYLPHHFFSSHVKQIWQEQYLLHAFLIFNREFEVLVSWSYVHFEASEQVRAFFPWYHSSRCPSSFWMRRVR
ncbi:MAG TPA: class I SAM-dependent methyltransferase [Vicinamibacterales bacterium]|nr:class I SAM-dependent methyltransferase [Vicinamibacterales bacterium]